MSKIEANTIDSVSGTSTLTLGSSNASTIALGSGDVQSNFLYPAFEAVLTSDQSVSHNTITKVQFNSEIYDTDNCYDNSSNYRFTPTKAGKYYVYAQLDIYAGASSDLLVANLRLYKNGSQVTFAYSEFSNNPIHAITRNLATVVDMNGSSDYLECFGSIEANSAGGEIFQGFQRRTNFGAYRIAT